MGKKQNRSKNKKPTRKSLIKALDTIVSLIVRARDKQCVNCGTRERLTCGHLFGRTNFSTRWDLTNCNCQCSSDNLTHDHNPYPYQEWWKRKYGETPYHALYQQWSRTTQYFWSNLELKQLLDDLTTYYNESIRRNSFSDYMSPVQFQVAQRLQGNVSELRV